MTSRYRSEMLTGCMHRTLPPLAVAFALAACGTHTPKPAAVRDATETATVTPATATATATTTPGMTHAQFARAVNASCTRNKPRADVLEKRFESAMERNQLREAGRIYGKMRPLLVRHVDRVAQLDVPAADRDAMRRYMSAERRLMGYGQRMGASLLDNDLTGVELLVNDFQREHRRRITAAIDMGADKCGG